MSQVERRSILASSSQAVYLDFGILYCHIFIDVANVAFFTKKKMFANMWEPSTCTFIEHKSEMNVMDQFPF